MKMVRSQSGVSFVQRSTRTLALVVPTLVIALGATAAGPADAPAGSRSTLAVTYNEGHATSVDLVGSTLKPGVLGKADVKRQQGRTRINLHLGALPHPQSFGSFYTSYVLWAVGPEGQAESLAELPYLKTTNIEVTTAKPTFGLIVTAEPHAAVTLPSPMVVAENTARENTEGALQVGRLKYGGAVDALYDANAPNDVTHRDFSTPPLLIGARHAVQLAKHAGAEQYASAEWTATQGKLADLERAAPRGGKLSPAAETTARDVMRRAENARRVASENAVRARATAESVAASASVMQAQSEAERARADTDQAQGQAAVARMDAAGARAGEQRAQIDAAGARAGEQQARTETQDALHAKAQAEVALQVQVDAQQKLYESLTSIIETRREARGLIVNLSDVLFETGSATLTSGAREKLSRLAGVLISFPGGYRLLTEGHTDSIGTDQFNDTLSRGRADSVMAFLSQAGIPAAHIATSVGFGKTRPVASNDTASGRQLNRRVEIVISELPV